MLMYRFIKTENTYKKTAPDYEYILGAHKISSDEYVLHTERGKLYYFKSKNNYISEDIMKEFVKWLETGYNDENHKSSNNPPPGAISWHDDGRATLSIRSYSFTTSIDINPYINNPYIKKFFEPESETDDNSDSEWIIDPQCPFTN